MSKPTVFLDLDGVLLDVRARFWAVQAAAVSALGGAALPEEAYWRGRQAGRTGRELAAQAGLSADRLAHFQEEWLARIESEEFLVIDGIVPGVIDGLEAIGRTHRRILTTLRANRRTLEWQVQQTGLAAHLDGVLPVDPRAGLPWEAKAQAMRGCGAPLDDGWMVGDTETDIRAGKLLGLRTVGVLTGLRGAEALWAEEPDFVVAALPDVVGLLTCTAWRSGLAGRARDAYNVCQEVQP